MLLVLLAGAGLGSSGAPSIAERGPTASNILTLVGLVRGDSQTGDSQTRSPSEFEQAQAARALTVLAKGGDENQAAIARAGAIEPLVALVSGGNAGAQEAAAAALHWLAFGADNQVAIARAGAIEPLVALLHEPTTAATTRAAASTMEHVLAQQHDQSGPLAVPQLGSCASSGRTWRPWAARHSHGRGQPTGRPATASAARASRLQSRRSRRRSRRLWNLLEPLGATDQRHRRTTTLPPADRQRMERARPRVQS